MSEHTALVTNISVLSIRIALHSQEDRMNKPKPGNLRSMIPRKLVASARRAPTFDSGD